MKVVLIPLIEMMVTTASKQFVVIITEVLDNSCVDYSNDNDRF